MKNIVENQGIKTDKSQMVVVTYEQLKQQFDALLDENVALKKLCKNAAFDADDIAEMGMERGGFTDALNDIKTPATSAALAEVEVRGLEKALAVISTCSKNICPGGLAENRQYEESIVQPHLDGIADELENLIIELREVAPNGN